MELDLDKINLDIKYEDFNYLYEIVDQNRKFYYGDIEDLKEYLDIGLYEEVSFFYERKKRLVYENILSSIINARVGLLTRRRMKTNYPSEFEGYFKDIDGLGNNDETFLKNAIKQSEITGITWVLIDTPDLSFNKANLSARDVKELNIRPYMTNLPFETVIDYDLDLKTKTLNWVVLKVRALVSKALPGIQKEYKDQWIVWTRDSYQVFELVNHNKYTPVISKTNQLGEIPIVPFYGIKRSEFSGLPTTYQILPHLKRILNIENQIDYAIELINLARLVIIAPESSTIDEVPSASNAFLLRYSEGESLPDVKYIEPTGNGIKLSYERIHDLISRIYRNTLFMSRKPTAMVQSVDAQREETALLKADLSTSASNHEMSWNACCYFFAKYLKLDINKNDKIVELIKDYDISRIHFNDVGRLSQLYQDGLLSKDSIWEQLILGEWLPEDFDFEQEKKRLQEELADKERAMLGLADIENKTTLLDRKARASLPDEAYEKETSKQGLEGGK